MCFSGFINAIGEKCTEHKAIADVCECKREQMLLLSFLTDCLNRDSSSDNPSPGIIIFTDEPSKMTRNEARKIPR